MKSSSRPPMLSKLPSSPAPATTLDDLAMNPRVLTKASTTASIYSHLTQSSPERDTISAFLRLGNGHSAASTSMTTISSSPPYSPFPLLATAEENNSFEINIEAIEPLPLTETNLLEHNARESGAESVSSYLLRLNFERTRLNEAEAELDSDADYVSQDYQSSLSISSVL